jgi:hypothetical protein
VKVGRLNLEPLHQGQWERSAISLIYTSDGAAKLCNHYIYLPQFQIPQPMHLPFLAEPALQEWRGAQDGLNQMNCESEGPQGQLQLRRDLSEPLRQEIAQSQ